MAEIPNTLTPSGQEEIRTPWGTLVSCLSTLDSFDVDKDSIKIGREVGCDIIFDKTKITSNEFASISKVHCLLRKDATTNNVFLNDLSKNGTFVNGIKIGKDNSLRLKDNDKIAIGQRSLDVYIFRSVQQDDLPNTLTPSLSQSPLYMPKPTLPTWGRLISCLLHLDSFDLCKSTFKVGRSSQCDAAIDTMGIDSSIKNRFSKEHFLLAKDPSTSITLITDLSKSGTFLNGRLIGKGKTNILQNDDTIAIGSRKTRVYVYKSMSSTDVNYLPPDLRRKYEPSKLLGKGACGEVRLAYDKCTCKMYAIKKILKARSTPSQMGKLNHPSKIQTEVNILESLSHPFVIRMKEIVETSDEVFIVLDYMKGGELNNRILSTISLTECNIKFLFYQMAIAVEFLHDHGITHRDLKPENVLLASDDVETLVKVSDFGLSKVTEDESMMKTMCGTLYYMAPEVLNIDIPEYNKQVDIWSLGVILFYMLSKRLPFQSPNKIKLCKLIKSGAYNMDDPSWNGISYFAKDLVRKMLTVDPEQRITINAILQHPWLSKDDPMQYRVQSLLQSMDTSSKNGIANEEPPTKRIRLSNSDEYTK